MINIGDDIRFTGEIVTSACGRSLVEVRWVKGQWERLHRSLYFWADSGVDWARIRTKPTVAVFGRVYSTRAAARASAHDKRTNDGYDLPLYLGTDGTFRWLERKNGSPPVIGGVVVL